MYRLAIFGVPAAFAVLLTLFRVFDGPGCHTRELVGFPSPSGRVKAVVYERDCGTDPDTTTNVAVLSAADPSLPESANVLVITGPADRGFRGGPEVRVVWERDTLLAVKYGTWARLRSVGTKVDGITIQHGRFE